MVDNFDFMEFEDDFLDCLTDSPILLFPLLKKVFVQTLKNKMTSQMIYIKHE